MLQIIYSNRLEELAVALAEEVGAADVFAPATVVVPGALVASWVKLALARRVGIAANLKLVFLEPWLGGLVEKARPEWRVLDRRMLQARLVALLGDAARMEGEELAPVRAYLEGASADAASADARRVQLAGQIAAQLVEYTTTRPEMVAAWSRPRGKVASPTEAWQRRLWRELVPAGATAAPLATLLAQVPPKELAPPAAVHVFGFSFMPRAHHAALARLAEASRVALHVVNPCREVWDDAGGRADAAAETPALALWGRPGREHNAALVELGQGDFADRFVDPGDETALRRLQRDTLDRAPRRGAADRAPAGGDASVRVLACPGPRRELETIAAMIGAALVEDATLRAADIALYLAPSEHERYQAQVGAVFDEGGGIPFRLVDRPPGGESRVAEALELLLDLPLGRFARPELLGLMIHPSVLAKHPDVDPDDWIRWCDELGIVHGADRRDHQGTYIDQDVYNWDQGLRRLALGSFMAHEPERGPVAVSIGAERYVPARVAPDDRRSAARFAHLARQLVADARACRAGERTLTEWAAHLDRLAATYLGAAGPADERALDRCREVLRRLAALDPGAQVSYATARELLREPLEELRAAGGELPTDAVLVAPLAAMRPLPFRLVFIAGLDAGRFPAGDRESGIDLREGARRAGDVSPRDRDRYAFLEALMSARDRLVLSYVARDEESGEELEPSSVVHELTEVLTEGYLAPEDADALEVRLPLRRWTGAPDGAVARRQAASATLRRDLAAHCVAAGAPVPGATELVRELARPERAELAAQLGFALGAEAAAAPPGRLARASVSEPLVVSLSALRKFLECPLQGWAAAALGLREVDEEDLVAQRDEPFERDLIAMTTGLREVFLAHLERGGDAGALLRLYREHSQRDQMTGRAPSGPFAAGAERRGARVLRRWRAALEKAAGSLPPARVIGFGAVTEGERVARLDAAIEIESAGRPVRLVGRSEPLAGASAGSLVLTPGDDARERHWLRGAIDAVALAAAGLDSGGAPAASTGGHRATLVTGTGRVTDVRFPAISRDAARAWLADRVAELFESAHDYLLPCEASLPVARRDRKAAPLETAVATLAGGRQWFSSMGGPLRLPRGLAAPAEGAALVARRFGIFLSESTGE